MDKKDVIYIDVEDDITAIIGKIKDAEKKIVALVPPKRVGVLQSAVNLRLLLRAAESDGKRVVLVTGNAALTHLAGSTGIPVAKTLQSAPKLPKPEVLLSEDDDVIDGNDLPVGEHVDASNEPVDDDSIEEITLPDNLDSIDIDRNGGEADEAKKPAVSAKKRIKVPDFNSFRKKLIFAGLGVVLLAGFLYWALAIAPRATIVVSAKTSDKVISIPVTIGADLATDGAEGTLAAVVKKDQDKQTVDFIATGKKNLGEKATGSITIKNSSPDAVTVSAGTQVMSSDGSSFLTASSATIQGATLGWCGGIPCAVPKSKSVDVVAAEPGASYNGIDGTVQGLPNGTSASFDDKTAGGTDKMVTVVTKADVDTARDQLKDSDQSEVRNQLKNTFGRDVVVLNESFAAKGEGAATSSPAVDEETPSGKATLTSDVSYSMMGVAKSELTQFLEAIAQKTLKDQGITKQRVYDNGVDTVRFSDLKVDDATGKVTAVMAATIQVGPKIDEDEIKDQAKDRKKGEVIDVIKKIDGVSDVDVQYSHFWVGTVPGNPEKITVEFKLLKNG